MARRFMLDPDKTAMENLWEAARMAAAVVLARRKFYGFFGEPKGELMDEVILATVADFMRNKVGRHTYCRVAKDGTPLNFGDNVISSCWSVAHHVADAFIKRVDKTNSANVDIADAQEYIKDGTVPLYVNYDDVKQGPHATELPYVRSLMAKDEYELQMADREELGIATVPLEQWLHDTGYDEDEAMMVHFMSPEERRKYENRKAYLRSLPKVTAKRRAAYEKRQKELEAEYGAPAPEGFEFYRWKDRVGIRLKRAVQSSGASPRDPESRST